MSEIVAEDDTTGLKYADGKLQSVCNSSNKCTIFFGNGMIIDSTLIFLPKNSCLKSVAIQNVSIENSSIIIDDVDISFVECMFDAVEILSNGIRGHNQLHIYKSIFKCNENQTELTSELKFHGQYVIQVSILESNICHSNVEISTNGIMLTISKSLISQTLVHVNVRSYLRAPSVINLEMTRFSYSNPNSLEMNHVILLELSNPYVIITNCSFRKTSVEIISMRLHSSKDLCFILMRRTYFSRGRKYGNGGAVSVQCDIENSQVVLSEVTFLQNQADRLTSLAPGNGGAVFVEGQSLHMRVEDCIFSMNTAVESGSSLFTSQGVNLSIINSSFALEFENKIPTPFLTINGDVEQLSAEFYTMKVSPEISTSEFHVVSLSNEVSNLLIEVTCPAWYTHLIEYNGQPHSIDSKFGNSSGQAVNNLVYKCGICMEDYYTTSIQKRTVSFSGHMLGIQQASESNQPCMKCPYGAICSGNNVIPRPNYWGFWYKDKLVFKQCPADYCCTGSDTAPCKVYSSCAGNRKGILCGTCEENFSVSILTGKCVSDVHCGDDDWFWSFAFLAAVLYAFWYSFKDDIFELFFICLKCAKNICINRKPKREQINVIVAQNVSDDNMDKGEKEQSHFEHDNNENADCGYFGILTYFIQMASVITIKIEFSDIDKSESVTDKISDSITTLLGIDLMALTIKACPILGLTTLGKHIFNLIFLCGIYASWFLLYGVNSVLLHIMNRKQTNTSHEFFKHISLKFITGIVEIIKYTYAGFCNIIFTSIVCIKIGKDFVWWYDANNVCFENWQILMMVFGLIYAVPFPITLFAGMKLLKKNEISARTFILSCMCPCRLLYLMLKHSYTEQPGQLSKSTSSSAIISLLQGPYRESDKNMTLYWEAMVSMRRLVITSLTLIPIASIRMIIITLVCVAFFGQQIHYKPFAIKTSNSIETLSLLLISMTSVINLLKACLTDSGIVPSGPSVSFFKTLELLEKMFVLVLIMYVLVVELNSYRKKKVV